MAYQSRRRTPSAKSVSTSPLGDARQRGQCCPGAWTRAGAPSPPPPPPLSTSDRRERAISILVTTLVLHGVAVASVMDPHLRGLETTVVRALWGATCLSKAKEIVFLVLSKGHRVSPVMHTHYERLLWLARVARRPGVTQVFTQAIWGSRGRAPNGGHLGVEHMLGLVVLGPPEARAPAALCARAPPPRATPCAGQPPLPFLRPAGGATPSHPLGAVRWGKRPGLPRGTAGRLHRAGEVNPCGLMAGALWTAARVCGHGRRSNSACLHCRVARKDGVHVLWDGLE